MSILIVSGVEGVRNCANVVARQLGDTVEVAEGRRKALDALRKKEFSAVVVDETLAECDPAAADAIWEHSGTAIPLQINFALSGAARIIREIRAALHRREREQATALQAASASIEKELKNTVCGLLLHFATGSHPGRCAGFGSRKTAAGRRSRRNTPGANCPLHPSKQKRRSLIDQLGRRTIGLFEDNQRQSGSA